MPEPRTVAIRSGAEPSVEHGGRSISAPAGQQVDADGDRGLGAGHVARRRGHVDQRGELRFGPVGDLGRLRGDRRIDRGAHERTAPNTSSIDSWPGRAPVSHRVVGQPADRRVERRRHAVQAPEQHDLSVEVVGLDRARPPGEALPTGGATALVAADRLDVQQLPARADVVDDIVVVLDLGRDQRRPALVAQPLGQLGAGRLGVAEQRADGVTEVAQQLRVLAPHHVAARLGVDPRARQRGADRLAPLV